MKKGTGVDTGSSRRPAARPMKCAAPAVLLANKWEEGVDPTGWCPGPTSNPLAEGRRVGVAEGGSVGKASDQVVPKPQHPGERGGLAVGKAGNQVHARASMLETGRKHSSWGAPTRHPKSLAGPHRLVPRPNPRFAQGGRLGGYGRQCKPDGGCTHFVFF